MATDFSGTSILSNDRLGKYRQPGGTFRSARQMWPMWPQVAKTGSKNQNLNGMI